MWKKIKRNNNYSINESGEVRNDKTGHIKQPFTNKQNGYLIVDLYQNNKSEKVPIHRLVAEAFIPNPENKKLDVIDTMEFESISETAKYFDCTVSNISSMLEKGTIGRRGRTRGYRFSYKNGERSKILKV